MDIASLLSPDSSPPASLQEAYALGEGLELLSSQNGSLALLDQQIAALTRASLTTARQRAQANSRASSSTLSTLAGATGTMSKPPVKRKRKRRPTVKQLQVMHENRHDDSLVYNLTLDVNELKQQVRDFIVRKSIYETRALVARQRFDAGILRTTEHFFQVFRTGFREWEPPEAAFLAATIDPDVALGSIASGTSIFFEQWRRYKKMLQQRYFCISSIRILVSDSESCVVECKGEFEGTLTLAAIEVVFPHILDDTELLSKVVNCRLVCPTRTLIYFDESGRIVQYDAHADMFTGLNRILTSNPMDIITLMSNARISTEGSMIPGVDDDRVVDISYDRRRGVEVVEVGEVGEVGEYDVAAGEGSSAPSPLVSTRSDESERASIEYILSSTYNK